MCGLRLLELFDEDLGLELFEKGFYVQSVIFPAVPYHAGVLRIQVNSNHRVESILGILEAFKALKQQIAFQENQTARKAA